MHRGFLFSWVGLTKTLSIHEIRRNRKTLLPFGSNQRTLIFRMTSWYADKFAPEKKQIIGAAHRQQTALSARRTVNKPLYRRGAPSTNRFIGAAHR
jgi:hypothetical protein